MEQLLINYKSVKSNKILKTNQKEYLKEHKGLKTKTPKAKLGKVFKFNGQVTDCTGLTDTMLAEPAFPENPKELIEAFRTNSIKGMSGSGFPEAEKIESLVRSGADRKYFIINAVACDPGLVQDAWLLENHKDEIQKGIDLINKCLNFRKCVIASASNVPARYPMGAENILIKYLLGIDIAEDEIPSDRGILVMNVQTVYSVYRAFYMNPEEESKYITFADLDSGEASIARVTAGQSIGEIVSKVKPDLADQKIYYGMGAMGCIEAEDDDKISIRTNLIAVATEVAVFDNDAKCRGCGKCASKCPMNVQVSKIMKADESNTYDKVKEYGIDNCIGCGTCSYYCRAGKNTMEIIKNIQNLNK